MPYCFIHIPRTAGTAFGTSLAGGFIATGRSVATYMSWDEYVTASDLDNYHLLGGHTTYQAKLLFKTEPLWLTMLGEPINRLISNCLFLMNHGLIGAQTVEEYLFTDTCATKSNNLQTRMIGADFSVDTIRTWLDFELKVQPTRDTLELAKSRLNEFFFVGIKEQLLESIVAVGQLLNLDLVLPAEGSRNRPHSSLLSASCIERAQELNQYDLELYEFGLALFKERYGKSSI